VRQWLETEFLQMFHEGIIPMARATTEAIECLLQSPVGIRLGNRTISRRFDEDDFVRGKFRVTESILAITLFEDTAMPYGQRR
jgi:hypothetical protein